MKHKSDGVGENKRIAAVLTILIAFLFLAFSYSFSQSYPEDEYTDVILLKNGGAYLGVKITEVVPRKKVVIENMDGVVIEIPFPKIYAITDKENYPAVRKEFEASRPPRQKELLSEPEYIGLLGIASGDGFSSITALLINGYNIDNFYAGAGLGWTDRRERGYLSFMIDFRIYSGIGRVKSFVYSEIGFFGGSSVGLGFGLKIPWGEPVYFMIQGGFRRQGNPEGDSYSSINIMLGLSFRL